MPKPTAPAAPPPPGAPKPAPKPAPSPAAGPDWSATLYLPKTDFPMRAGLPDLEPKILKRWADMKLFERLRKTQKGRKKFLLHDGPPYANGNIHIGHALNKILKDLVVRTQGMLGFDSNYVPGWDCHGLPIEWKIEEAYRAKGKSKDSVPVNEFRRECREFAEHWIGVQREEFKRLGVEGDWDHYYSTMAYASEAAIAGELMKFAMNGLLYRGSKPVMWSVVEQTALAEAEIEYQDYQSDMIWVKFPVKAVAYYGPRTESLDLSNTSVVIWTTTPWTMPGNRAIAYSKSIRYGVYEVTQAPAGNWAKPGDKYILADNLAAEVMKAAKVEAFEKRAEISADLLSRISCKHPLYGHGYDFDVPLLPGDHVTDDAGTGFVHTAPGHGTDDFNVWVAHARDLAARGIKTDIPFTVDNHGYYTAEAPGFEGKRVITDKGDKGDANDAVIKALAAAGALIARGRLKHQYPHSWRSKKPVIFRNTPQWFIAMDKAITGQKAGANATLREVALKAIAETEFVPKSGQNRIRGMIEAKPDWVLSRQRAWGVPITVFMHSKTGEVIPGPQFARSAELIARITKAMQKTGADAWFEDAARDTLLAGLVPNPADWEKVTDILDVWFDSGSTHAYVIDDRPELNVHRIADGGHDRVMYLEGSDQHRGWFHSSLLESCGTRGRAPFDAVLTHGFCLDEKGQKMSKSVGNVVAPQDVIKSSGADILRLWVAASDYSDDLRIGPEILKSFVDAYRKIRNSLRWMLGTLHHLKREEMVAFDQMPELERLMLHRLTELERVIRKAYAEYDYAKVVSTLSQFLNSDLSAFYFDVRKDALYCEPPSSTLRLSALTAIDEIFRCVTLWLAPILVFTAEEAWMHRYPGKDDSVHLHTFPEVPSGWADDKLAARWEAIRTVRRVVTGALEIARADKKIGSSLEAAPVIYLANKELKEATEGADWDEIAMTSGARVVKKKPPEAAFAVEEIHGVGVVVEQAQGKKCQRSWRYTSDVGADPDYPDLSARDAKAVRELKSRGS